MLELHRNLIQSSLESRARITTRNSNIRLVWRGSRCATDGSTIWLPFMADATDEVVADLGGMLDHEMSHCLFTDFEAMKDLYKSMLHNRFLKEFFNAVEDSRIELKYTFQYPGSKIHLDRLNEKWKYKSGLRRFTKKTVTVIDAVTGAKSEVEKWVTPWPVRLITAMREVYDFKAPMMDEQTEPILIKIIPEIEALRDCTDSRSLILACEAIRVRINEIRESLYVGGYELDDETLAKAMEALEGMECEVPLELNPDRKEGPSKEAVGEEQLDPATETTFEEGSDGIESDEEGETGDTDKESDSESESDSEGNIDEVDAESTEAESDNDSKASSNKASISAEAEGAETGEGTENEDADEAETNAGGKGKTDEETESDSIESDETSNEMDALDDTESDEIDSVEDNPTEGQEQARNEAAPDLDAAKSTDKKEGEADTPSVYREAIETAAADWSEDDTEKQMFEDEDTDESEFDNHVFSAESYMEVELEKAFAKETDEAHYDGKYDGKTINERNVSLPFTQEFDEVIDYTGQGDREDYAERKRIVMPVVTPVRTHLERVLKVKENVRTIFDRERGALNSRRLFSVVADKNYRTPFKETTSVDTKNVAIGLVMDCSGSMHGDKMEVARQTALALAESLKAIQIPLEVTGFNTAYSRELQALVQSSGYSPNELSRFNRLSTILRLMVFKSFESSDLSGIGLAESGGANADGESLIWAAKRLDKRPEARKILIVLSDGQPSDSGDDDILAGDLKRTVKLLTKSNIETIGIGIQTDAPKYFYPKSVEVNNINTLPSVVMKEISKMLIEGLR